MTKTTNNPPKLSPIPIWSIVFWALAVVLFIVVAIIEINSDSFTRERDQGLEIGIGFIALFFIFMGFVPLAKPSKPRSYPPTEEELLQRLVDKPAPQILVKEVKIRCTNCKTLNEEDAKFCKNCAKEL